MSIAMKSAAAALAVTGSGVVLGSFVAVEAGLAIFQIGGETGITGLTVGGLIVAASGGIGAVFIGGRYLLLLGIRLGQTLTRLEGRIETNSVAIQANTEHISALTRWREAKDPIVTEWERRLGLEAIRKGREGHA